MDIISGLGLLAIVTSPPIVVLWRIQANEDAGRFERADNWRVLGIAGFVVLCVVMGCYTSPDSADVFPGDVVTR